MLAESETRGKPGEERGRFGEGGGTKMLVRTFDIMLVLTRGNVTG